MLFAGTYKGVSGGHVVLDYDVGAVHDALVQILHLLGLVYNINNKGVLIKNTVLFHAPYI